MKRLLYGILLIISTVGMGQGIKFERGLSWKQVQAKAKQENKFIFIDYYATWCSPCKAMDKDIYPSARLGNLVNTNFISIKVQQDRTSMDDDTIRSWYQDADSLAKVYNILSFPSLLFFSPDGDLIIKTVGYQDEPNLMAHFDSAMTTKAGYQTQIELYRECKLSFEDVASLALKAREIGNRRLADTIAMDYENKYLYQLNDSLLLTKVNLRFITSFPISSNDRIFNLFYKNPKVGDELTRAGYSHDIVKFIISKEEIDDKLFYRGKPLTRRPDWIKMRQSIEKKYGTEWANFCVSLSTEIAFYRKIHDWRRFADLVNKAIALYPPTPNGYKFATKTMLGNFFQRDDWNLNAAAWDVFLYCMNKSILKMALRWSNVSILVAGTDNEINPIDQYIDTKANLLYKIGKIKEAIVTEEKAYEILNSNAEKKGIKGSGKSYLATLETMKRGKPTWESTN
jgi:thioredoxin-related protein